MSFNAVHAYVSLMVVIMPIPCFADFSKIFNVPNDDPPHGLLSNMQLNLFDGGVLPSIFNLGNTYGDNSNVELNVYGGWVGPSLTAASGSTLNVFGGTIADSFRAAGGSNVRLAGGTLTSGYFDFGSSFTLVGNNFRIDDALAPGAGSFSKIPVSIPLTSVLSGTLSDGTNFAFSGEALRGNTSIQYAAIPVAAPGEINVPGDPVPKNLYADQRLIVRDGGQVSGLNAAYGSAIEIYPGGTVTSARLIGTTVNMLGGRMDFGTEAGVDSVINLKSGTLSSIFANPGSVVKMTGGTVDSRADFNNASLQMSAGNLWAGAYFRQGSVAEISGGFVGHERLFVESGSELRVTGGYFYGGIHVADGAAIVSGGSIANIVGAKTDLSGGVIRDHLTSVAGGRTSLIGGSFRIDGEPVAGLDSIGQQRQVNIPDGSVVTGVFVDGTPFMFSSSDISRQYFSSSSFADGTLHLVTVATPDVGHSYLTASVDGPVASVREGQTLIVDVPGVIGDEVRTALGSRVDVLNGGTIGSGFEASGAIVNINGGAISWGMDVAAGAIVKLNAGSIAGGMDVIRGGTVEVRGGTLDAGAYINSGGLLEVVGGSVGDSLRVFNGGRVLIAAGRIGKETLIEQGGEIEINGGEVGAKLTLRGKGLIHGGVTTDLRVEGGELQFTDGRVNGLSVGPDAHAVMYGGTTSYLTLHGGGEMMLHGGVTQGDVAVGSGSKLSVTGGALENQFTASYNSNVSFSGGAIGGTFQTFAGSNVQFAGGEFAVDGAPIAALSAPSSTALFAFPSPQSVLTGVLADGSPFALSAQDLDAVAASTLRLSVVNLPVVDPADVHIDAGVAPRGLRTGQRLVVEGSGVVPKGFNAHPGSVVELLDGATVGENFEASGAVVNMRGGTLGKYADAFHGTVFNIAGGSVSGNLEVHRGAVVNVSGGTVSTFNVIQGSAGLIAKAGGQINVSGGEIGSVAVNEGGRAAFSGGRFVGDVDGGYDAEIQISGGRFEEDFYLWGASTNVSGGHFDGLMKVFGREFNLFVTEAAVSGVTIGEFNVGESQTIDVRDVLLTGRLAEGMPFEFDLNTDDDRIGFDGYFSPFVKLTVTRVFNPGDYNGDRVVDDRDHDVWMSAVLNGNLAADGNYDGQVDNADLQVWSDRYGRDYSLIPEPASLILAAIGMLFCRNRAQFTNRRPNRL